MAPVISNVPAADALDQVAHINSIFDTKTLMRRGLCEVATTKQRAAQSHRLYYEIHGTEDKAAKRLVFIMGLNNSSFAWSNQVKYFANLPGYSVLVFDNRGVGHSEHPGGAYTTSEMAKDVEELLDFVGWTEKRSLAVIGISMGGMIALELAKIIPERIASLLLTSTRSGNRRDMPSGKVVYMFARLLTGTVWTPQAGIALMVDSLFPTSYLDVDDGNGGTKRQAVEADFMVRYKIGKPQSLGGRFGQMAAVLRHNVSREQLEKIATSIPKIAIITGDLDSLINHRCSYDLFEEMPGSEYKLVKGGGHALPSQITREYNEWIVRVVDEGLERSKAELAASS